MNNIFKALVFAADKHKNQKRKKEIKKIIKKSQIGKLKKFFLLEKK